MPSEHSQIDARVGPEEQLEKVMSKFEGRLACVDPEVHDIVREHFGVLGEAFEELKQDFSERLAKAVGRKGDHDLAEALKEMSVLLEAVGDAVESGLMGYAANNNTEGENILTSSHFKKKFDEGEVAQIQIDFNFKPPTGTQQRMNISCTCHDGSIHSFRIDYDPALGGVYIDVQTPAVDKLLQGVEGARSKGTGHHFWSKSLTEFVKSGAEFAGFIKKLKTALTSPTFVASESEADEDEVMRNLLNELKEKYKKE